MCVVKGTLTHSQYPLKKQRNWRKEIRIATLTQIAIRDGINAAKEYAIKNLKLSESTWEHGYKARIMQVLKDYSPRSHYPIFQKASEI